MFISLAGLKEQIGLRTINSGGGGGGGGVVVITENNGYA